jgi:hypothetical protein
MTVAEQFTYLLFLRRLENTTAWGKKSKYDYNL